MCERERYIQMECVRESDIGISSFPIAMIRTTRHRASATTNRGPTKSDFVLLGKVGAEVLRDSLPGNLTSARDSVRARVPLQHFFDQFARKNAEDIAKKVEARTCTHLSNFWVPLFFRGHDRCEHRSAAVR